MTGLKRKRGMTLTKRRSITGLLFVSPFIIGFLAFYVRSLIMTFEFALSETTLEGVGYSLNFVGLDNFRKAFMEHPSFRQTLTSSVGNMLIDVPLILFFSLFMAMLLNQKFKGRTVARAIFFLPVLLNAPAISGALETVQAMMLGGVSPASDAMVAASSSDGGMGIEYYFYLLRDFAMPEWLLDYVMGAVSRISAIITASGVQIIIFLAALQSISPAMYEVAKIEGATPYETFWKVTFPMVSPLLVTNMVYTVVDSFVNSEVLDLAYSETFLDYNYSLGAVFSIISTVCVCGILLVVSKFISKRTFYHN